MHFSIPSLSVLYVSLDLKWVSCRQHICGLVFVIHSASLCLLVGAFNLFQFSWVTQLCPTLRPHEPWHTRPPCPSPTPRDYSNSCPLSRWCHLTISSSVVPFSSCLQSSPTSGSFQMSQLLVSGGQSTGASASPVAYWAPTDLGSSSFSVLSFWLFILFMEFSRQEYWSGLPFPSPVDHILSDLSTMTPLSWVAPHGMA